MARAWAATAVLVALLGAAQAARELKQGPGGNQPWYNQDNSGGGGGNNNNGGGQWSPSPSWSASPSNDVWYGNNSPYGPYPGTSGGGGGGGGSGGGGGGGGGYGGGGSGGGGGYGGGGSGGGSGSTVQWGGGQSGDASSGSTPSSSNTNSNCNIGNNAVIATGNNCNFNNNGGGSGGSSSNNNNNNNNGGSGSGGSIGGLPGLPNPLQLVGSALGIILNFATGGGIPALPNAQPLNLGSIMGLSSPQETAGQNSPITTQADSMLANLNNNNGGVVAQSLASAVNPNNATSATVSSTQAYNTASTFTAAAAKANSVQPSLSPQVGQSFVKGLNDAMAPCVRALPAGASVTQCCSIVQGTLQNANTLGQRAGTSSVFTTALDAYPNVKACQTTAVASATSTAGR